MIFINCFIYFLFALCQCLDLTDNEGGNDAELFRNRKGYFSINTQVIGDAELKIRDVVANWPGSTHDQTIFINSRIRARFEANEFPNFALLGYSNDSPYIVEEPKIESIRVKVGTPITLKCVQRGIWEYKQCEPSYKGVICNTQDITKTDSTELWRRLRMKERFEIDSSNKTHSGLYRCVEKGVVKKTIIVEVVGVGNYDGPPPSVASLRTSNITSQLNMEFTIQCNVTSIIPPTVIWFKKCYGLKCDIRYDSICYCHLNVTTSVYNLGNTYISKINIFNAREIDSGLYACLAVTEYGKDYKKVTISVPNANLRKENNSSFSLLFLIPFALIFAPIAVWLCYFRKKKKSVELVNDQHKKLVPKNLSSLNTRPARQTV